ncbi:MAG TPA: hypothetical protein VFP58_07270 [Candidatus Eisenbacteria bacterium]|nr:hypothetical protein [Candidatus Eisenbacteria bacterium]
MPPVPRSAARLVPSLALGVALAIAAALSVAPALGAAPASAAPPPESTAVSDTTRDAAARVDAASAVDASTLYNAGTAALERGEIGPAVAFLVAARRLEPRASDIRANLESAEAASLRARGGDASDADAFELPTILSAHEAWWLAASLLAGGALLAVLGIRRTLPARWRLVSTVLLVVGFLFSGWRHIQAWEEASHPEAVVVVPALSVERGPDEPSRAAVLLGAGERVRLGASRGRQTEIRIGGNSIGWADREGLWKVVEAPRYTSQYAKR